MRKVLPHDPKNSSFCPNTSPNAPRSPRGWLKFKPALARIERKHAALGALAGANHVIRKRAMLATARPPAARHVCRLHFRNRHSVRLGRDPAAALAFEPLHPRLHEAR